MSKCTVVAWNVVHLKQELCLVVWVFDNWPYFARMQYVVYNIMTLSMITNTLLTDYLRKLKRLDMCH